jgi:hypothetical protein
MNPQSLEVSIDVDNLEQIIKAVRSGTSLILIFEETPNDYLSCVAGGIFATKQRAYTPDRKSYDLDCFLLDLSPSKSTPGLLTSHPQAITCDNISDLESKFLTRLRYIQNVIKKKSRAKK